jgi:hypothetical protein
MDNRLTFLQKEDSYKPFERQNTPEWLEKRTQEIQRKYKTYNIFPWIATEDLPEIIIDHNCLNQRQKNAFLAALYYSSLESSEPLLLDLKKYGNRPSIDCFVWKLFEMWLSEGGTKKEKWAMCALGLLGSDEIVIKLTAYIKKWPGESQHYKAILGLQCLQTIGSDLAIMQIDNLARKNKYQGFKKQAEESLQAIARHRRLSPERLADRIVPTFGLDKQDKREFDFGERKFSLILTESLKPFLRDEKGKIAANLPKPSQQDNPELANRAIAEWKLLKKQIDETLKIQTARLEQALVWQRRWEEREFVTLLANHPLMTHLVQKLIWAGYDNNNNLITTFRLAEDRTYANTKDEEISLSGISTIGIIHPLDLTLEQKAAWREIFTNYEIISPFPQIEREVYTLSLEEANSLEIVRFQKIIIPGITLLRTMEQLGWLKGKIDNRGQFFVHYKYFPHANITAITGEYAHQYGYQNNIDGDDEIDGCLFCKGQYEQPAKYPLPESWYNQRYFQGKHLKLKDVDPIVMSEVWRDLYIVTSKGKY